MSNPPHPTQLLTTALAGTGIEVDAGADQAALPAWDSLVHLSYLLLLETHYQIPLTQESYDRCRSIAGTCALLCERGVDLPAEEG